MVVVHVGGIRYHTRLKADTAAHSTRESAEYAAALLETGVDWRIRRAKDILHAVLNLQDADESSPTYGIWPWFLEEPLEAMSPPDWNWADFIGTHLAQILCRRADHLDFSLGTAVESALRHAAGSIIRRDVTMRYTNIAIMGTYVTVMAGTILEDDGILEYGRNRLRRFQAFTEDWGGFAEYNSPTYTIVSLAELTRMLRDFPDEADRRIVQDLHDRAWREIAVHWHAFSGQWSGPHSRSYQTLLLPEILGFIRRGVGSRLPQQKKYTPAVQEILLPICCPDALLPYFEGKNPATTHRQRIVDGEPALEGVSFLAKKFALASAERGTFWNQSRVLTAYSHNSNGPTAWHVRVLRNGYDYSSANLISTQLGPRILGAICFATDGGNVHCSLDRIQDASVEASDWRLRFQCHGSVGLPELPGTFSTQQILSFKLADDVVVSMRIPWVGFGFFKPRWELVAEEEGVGVDMILYHGLSRHFVFNPAFPCAIGLAVTANTPGELEGVHAEIAGERLNLEWPVSKGEILQVSSPLFASSEAEITAFAQDLKSRRGL
ncbi:MAG: hypothetical protein ACOYM3_16845 [Terrimicrobiaceae bacterium]